ncbi:MAG: amidase [Spirochaetaceae bacterium]
MTTKEYAERDALDLAQLIRGGEVTEREVTEAAEKLLEELNPKLNAVVRRFRHPPEAPASGGSGRAESAPFGGVPFLFKDNIEVEGWTVTHGSVLLEENRAEFTHEVARRMIATGVRVLGQTNLSEYGLLPYSESRLYGAVRNPWNPEHSAGGSSGGSAAAVAAGIVPMAHGNDGGGSIRIPASACGVVGLKPSRGRNPARLPGFDGGIVANHVLTRTVRDSAAMLDAICGPRPGERWMLPKPERPFSQLIEREPPQLRIAFTTSDFLGNRAEAECRRAVESMAAWCEELGHFVEEASPQIDGVAFNNAFKLLWAQGAGSVYRIAQQVATSREEIPGVVRGVLRSRRIFRVALALSRRNGMPVLEPFTRRLAAIDASLSPSDLTMAQTSLKRVEQELDSFLSTHDLFLSPVLGEPPHILGTFDQSWATRRAQEFLNRYVAYTPIANTTGLPAMSIPTAWTDRELPVGTQFLANLGREDLLLQLAAQLEQAHPWAGRHPRLSAWGM